MRLEEIRAAILHDLAEQHRKNKEDKYIRYRTEHAARYGIELHALEQILRELSEDGLVESAEFPPMQDGSYVDGYIATPAGIDEDDSTYTDILDTSLGGGLGKMILEKLKILEKRIEALEGSSNNANNASDPRGQSGAPHMNYGRLTQLDGKP